MKRIVFIISFIFLSLSALAIAPRLEVETLFDGQYNKEKNVRITITRNHGELFRVIHVSGNSGIIKLIEDCVRKDLLRAEKSVEQEGDGGSSILMQFVNNGETIKIGLQKNGDSASLFIKGSEKAFK
ncbi:MAG: hypothetical protein K2L14_10540 [Duncaniella sp.]|nr:hypothetical protein [Duncaniella sp.]